MPDRIFTAFAIEDANLRTMLVGQARHEHSPFEFLDMSVKEPWDRDWKEKCRTRTSTVEGNTSKTWEIDGTKFLKEGC